jgi:hypothetical protein
MAAAHQRGRLASARPHGGGILRSNIETRLAVIYLFSFKIGPKLGHNGGGVVGV